MLVNGDNSKTLLFYNLIVNCVEMLMRNEGEILPSNCEIIIIGILQVHSSLGLFISSFP